MDDAMNISWDVKVESIKKIHIEKWWNKENSSKSKKSPTIQDLADVVTEQMGVKVTAGE